MTLLKLPHKNKYLYQIIRHLVAKKFRAWRFGKRHNPVAVEDIHLCRIGSTDVNDGFYETLVTCPIQTRVNTEENEIDYPSSGKLIVELS